MKLFNRVKFATSTTGTSNLAVGARKTGFLTPALAGIANNDKVPYFIEDGDNFAHGLGTYSTTGPTLTRDSSEMSFNGTTYAAGKLSLSGSAAVFIAPGRDALGTVPSVTSSASASNVTPSLPSNGDAIYRFTALAADLTINAPTGTAYDGQEIAFELSDDGTERSIIWDSAYRTGAFEPLDTNDIALFESTYCDDGVTPYPVFQKTARFRYNATRGKWVGVRAYKENYLIPGITYVGGGSYAGAPATTKYVSLTSLSGGSRTAAQAGDLVVIAIAGQTPSDVSGWIVTAGFTKLSPDLYANDVFDTNLSVFYKLMGASPDTLVELNLSALSQGVAYTYDVYEGVDPDSPFDVAETSATGTNTGNASPASITPATPNAVIQIVCAATSGSTFTDSNSLSGYNTSANATYNISIASGHKYWSGGTFSPSTMNSAAHINYSWAAYTLALRPQSLN